MQYLFLSKFGGALGFVWDRILLYGPCWPPTEEAEQWAGNCQFESKGSWSSETVTQSQKSGGQRGHCLMSKSGTLLNIFCLFVFFSQVSVHEPRGLNNLKAKACSTYVYVYNMDWGDNI